jgi:hypothetical protein
MIEDRLNQGIDLKSEHDAKVTLGLNSDADL